MTQSLLMTLLVFVLVDDTVGVYDVVLVFGAVGVGVVVRFLPPTRGTTDLALTIGLGTQTVLVHMVPCTYACVCVCITSARRTNDLAVTEGLGTLLCFLNTCWEDCELSLLTQFVLIA